jgi:hypothetical protein
VAIRSDGRRERRIVQLAAMPDEFLLEVRQHQQSSWRRGSLARHFEKHRPDLEEYFGVAVSPEDVVRLTADILYGWQRLFTGLTGGDQIKLCLHSSGWCG